MTASLQTRGFSLVEVTLALGVAAFCLVTVLGLLPVGVKTNQNASQQTMAANILSEIVSDLRATPKTVPLGIGCQSKIFKTTFPNNPFNPWANTLYFALDGSQSIKADDATVFYANADFIAANNTQPRRAAMVHVTVSWPYPGNVKTTPAPAGSFETFVGLDRN